MDDTTLYMLIAGQVAMVLLGLIIFMFLFIRKLKAKNQDLVSKTTKALTEASKLIEEQKKKFQEQQKKKAKEPAKQEAQNQGPSIQSYLSEQISLTQSKLSQAKDTDAPINLEGNPTEIAASLRQHILQGELTNQSNLADKDGFWAHYTSSLAPLVQAISELKKAGAEADSETTNKLEEQIKEHTEQKVVFETKLEKIKTEWDDSFLEMDKLYSELVDTSLDSDKKEVLLPLIDKFQNNALKMGHSISGEEVQTVDSSSKLVTIVEKEVVEKNNSSELREASHEINRLRSVNQEQQKLIGKLKDDLQHIDVSTEGGQAKAEYEQQVLQLENLMRENETCILTLEQELNSAHDKIDELQDALDNSEPEAPEADPDKSEEIKAIVDKFAGESRSLIDTIRNLERDLSRYRAAEAEEHEANKEEINDPGVDALLSRGKDSSNIGAMPGVKPAAIVEPGADTELIAAAVPKPVALDEIPEDTPQQTANSAPSPTADESAAPESDTQESDAQESTPATESIDPVAEEAQETVANAETSASEIDDILDRASSVGEELDLDDAEESAEENDLDLLDTATSDEEMILDSDSDLSSDLDLSDDNGEEEQTALETAPESTESTADLTDDLDALLAAEQSSTAEDDQESVEDLLDSALAEAEIDEPAPSPEPAPQAAKQLSAEEELAASEHLSEDLDSLLSDIETEDEDDSDQNPLGEEGLHLDDEDIEEAVSAESSIDYVEDGEENPLEDLLDAMSDEEDSSGIDLDELEDSIEEDTTEEDPDALLQQLMEENNLNDDSQNPPQ